MKVTNLKIGNWINIEGKPIKVKSLTNELDGEYDIIGGINGHREDFEYLSFIPLTEEMLLKCGAKKSILVLGNLDAIYWMTLPTLKAELHFEFYSYEIVVSLRSQFCELILNQVKYLHEIQNLYKELEKTELEINL